MQIFRRPSYPARQTVREATATTEREIQVSMVEKGDTVLTKTAFRMLHLPQLYGKVKTAVEKNITWQVRTRVGNKVKENSVTEPNLGFLVVRLKSTADALKTRSYPELCSSSVVLQEGDSAASIGKRLILEGEIDKAKKPYAPWFKKSVSRVSGGQRPRLSISKMCCKIECQCSLTGPTWALFAKPTGVRMHRNA